MERSQVSAINQYSVSQYRRPHQKYGTRTLNNNDKNPAQRRLRKSPKRGRRNHIGNPRYSNHKSPVSFDGKTDMEMDMDMDSGEELIKNKTKLEENHPRLRSTSSKKRKRNSLLYTGCPSNRGTVPWQVILEDFNCATLCGGTQINLKFILTAAHCMDQFKKKPSKLCPTKKVKKVIPYPKNILSKYVLYFCCYTSKKSTYHNHRDNS